jgi:hypothetical protein
MNIKAQFPRRTNSAASTIPRMDAASACWRLCGILVARHLKTADDLLDSKPSPRIESMVAAAVQWAERIMRKG